MTILEEHWPNSVLEKIFLVKQMERPHSIYKFLKIIHACHLTRILQKIKSPQTESVFVIQMQISTVSCRLLVDNLCMSPQKKKFNKGNFLTFDEDLYDRRWSPCPKWWVGCTRVSPFIVWSHRLYQKGSSAPHFEAFVVFQIQLMLVTSPYHLSYWRICLNRTFYMPFHAPGKEQP